MIAQPVARVSRVCVCVIVMAGLGACGGQQATKRPAGYESNSVTRASSKHVTVGERAAAIAARQVGTPYRYGGSSPQGFDCSGLVHYAYARAGKSVPRTTAQLWAGVEPVQSSRMQAGDLLFFKVDGKMSHVGMYLGDGQFVHAPSSGRTVSVETLGSEFYRRALLRAGRPY